jgi:hypothetical protein
MKNILQRWAKWTALAVIAGGGIAADNKTAPTAKLRSTVFDWMKLTATPTPNGERRDVLDGPTDTVDKLAQQYVKKYFDAPAPKANKASKAAAAASQRAAMKRWFE